MADKKKICILVSPDEYDLIAANAESLGMTLSGYVRRVSLDRIVVHNNYQAIMDYTKVMNRMKTDINRALNYLVETGVVYPADIRYIIDLLGEVTENQRKLLNMTHKDRDYIRKYIRNLLEEATKCQ